MTADDFTTPKQAVQAMLDAGAIFTVRQRGDTLGISFSYRVEDGGDIDRCRNILAAVKSKPAPFFEAFRAAVQDAADQRFSEGGVSTPSSLIGRRPVGGAKKASSRRTDVGRVAESKKAPRATRKRQ